MLDLKALLNKMLTQWGGSLISKLYTIFSHLERWWEYVRFKGVAGENIKRSIQSCRRDRLLSTCKLQRDDTHGWFNNLYQITKRSLCGFLFSRCKNDASTNGVGCNKDSGEQSYIRIYKSILLYIKHWWHTQILLRKQSRCLAQCHRYLERKYRLSSWRCGTNVRYGRYNITQISNGGGVGYVRFKGFIGEGADQSPVVVLQCVRKRLRQLLQGAESWQGCTRLGRILKWLDNHARRLSCVDNIITTIQTIAERQICMWRIGWNARDNRLRQYGWDCVSIYNGNHCILEFHSNLLCEIISERGCLAC